MANIIELLIKGSAKNAISSLKQSKDMTRATRTEVSLMISTLSNLALSLKKATDISDDYNASMTLLRTTFGKGTQEAIRFRNNLTEITGLDENRLNRQIAKFDILGKSLNLNNEYAEKFSKNLTVLSSRLAMLYNVDASVMAQSVQNAIQGTQTTLRSMTGIEATEIAEQAILVENGINRTVSSLNDAEEGILRYAAIIRQVTNNTKTYENAVNSLAWQKQVFTSQVKRLATAIGQFLSPAFNNLLIIVNAVLMVITELIRIIGSLFNINMDLDSATNEVATGYENLGKSISGASTAAKRSLRAFDKLNNITTPTTGGAGGGGAGNLGIDDSILKLLNGVDDTFDKIRNKATEIRDKIMEWLGFTKDVNGQWKWSADTLLKNIWNWWKELNVLGKIFVGLGLATVMYKVAINASKLLKAFLSFTGISSFIELLKKTKGNLIDVGNEFLKSKKASERFALGLVGLVASTGGLAMLISGVQKAKEEGFNFNNILEIVIGTLGLVGGAILTVGAIMGGLTVQMALATGGISLLIGGIAALVAWFATQNKNTKETITAIGQYNNAIREAKKAQEEEKIQLEAKVSRVKVLKDELKSLVDENGNVIGSEKEVGAKLHELNNLLGTEYKVTGKVITINGKKIRSYEDLADSVDVYCEKLKAQALLEIAQEEYNTRLKENIKLQKEKNARIQDLIKTQEGYNITTKEGYKKWFEDNSKQIEELRQTMSVLDENGKYLDAYAQAAYEASVGNYERSNELLTTVFRNTTATTENTLRELENAAYREVDIIQNAINEITYQSPTVTMNLRLNTVTAQQQIDQLFAAKQSIQGINIPIRARASGGFPSEGELFMAREAGPELVGSINGHTAVANNDQIVKGIQSGVFSGMMSALRNSDFGGSNVTIEASGDTEGLLNFISFKQKQVQRQFT